MASPEVCVCSSSDGDSALSTIANIISILTFAYVLVIGGLFQVASYRRANYNFSGLRDRAADLRKQAREIQALYRQRADKLPGAKAWDLTAEAIKTANSLSKDLEKAEKRASSKWYLVWQEVTFKSAKERSAWEQELDEAFMILSLDRLFIEGGFHGDLGGLDAQQLAYLENRPEDLKRLRQLMNEFQVSLLRLLRPYAVDKRMVRQQGDSESIDGINFCWHYAE